MKATKQLAVGYTSDGEKKEFEIINGVLRCVEAREFILRRVLLPKNSRRTKRKMPRRRI